MKAFKLTPDQKRWGLTMCLIATIGFNLSHLADTSGDEQKAAFRNNIEGQSEFASVAAPKTEKKEEVITETKAEADSAREVKAPPSTTTAAPRSSASSDRKQGTVIVDGKSVPAEFIKTGDNQVIVNLRDPNLKLYEGAQCPDGRCNMVQFNGDINDPNISTIASLRIRDIQSKVAETKPEAKKEQEEEDLAAIPVDKLTEAQKDKRADQILAEIEKTCSERSSSDSQITCYTDKLKSVLGNADNKKIISESKVTEFIDTNVKDKIGEHLKENNFNASSTAKIRNLHKALPGKYKDARTSVNDMLRETLLSKADEARALSMKVSSLETEAAQLTKDIVNNTGICKGLSAMQYCIRRQAQLNQRLDQARRQYLSIDGNLDFYLENVMRENRNGLNWAGSNHRLEDAFRTQLMDRLDELSLELHKASDPIAGRSRGLERIGRGEGRRTDRTSGRTANRSDGVRPFRLGEKLTPPSDAISRGSRTNGVQTLPGPGQSFGSGQPSGVPAAPTLRAL